MVHYDYLVVGSGAAGGVVAHNLQVQGADVGLIEAGKHFNKDTFPRNEADATAQLYWGGGIELARDASMGFLRAKTVGGTTIVNQALIDRFDSIAWQDWRDESRIWFFVPELMRSYYSAVESLICHHTFSQDEMNESARLVSGAMDKLGYDWKYLRRAQGDCAIEKNNDCIACLSGCHRDSKQSSLVTYVRRAEQHGLKIFDQSEVTTIEHQKSGVVVNVLRHGRFEQLRANHLILCAGSLGTTKILLSSGFAKHYPALGKNFSSHPQYMTFGRFENPVSAHKGYFQTIASNDPTFRQQGFKIEVVYAPPVSLAVLFPKFGAEHQRLMQAYNHYSCVEVAIRDENIGTISLDKKGRLLIDKPLTDLDRKKRDAGQEVVRNIMHTAGASEIIQSPVYFGLHLMGGAVIGSDPNKSVVNESFCMHDHPRIYVVDSSIFPNAPGINPSLTVYALGERLSRSLGGTV